MQTNATTPTTRSVVGPSISDAREPRPAPTPGKCCWLLIKVSGGSPAMDSNEPDWVRRFIYGPISALDAEMVSASVTVEHDTGCKRYHDEDWAEDARQERGWRETARKLDRDRREEQTRRYKEAKRAGWGEYERQMELKRTLDYEAENRRAAKYEKWCRMAEEGHCPHSPPAGN